jgi:transcription elongation factor Elf1
MSKPFTCPHCGSHDYAIVLTGCKVLGATIEESFNWNPLSSEYQSSGPVLTDSESIDNEGGEAVCSNCEKDVSDAVSAYEASIGPEAAQA